MLRTRARINSNRLWESIGVSAVVGAYESGLRRLALSDADKVMRDMFVNWCMDAGLDVSIDPVGNIFARRDGLENSLSPVVIGGHFDTNDEGGRVGGPLGILAALELLRTLNDLRYTTRRPLMLVNWTNEAGFRFNPGTLGARVVAGGYAPTATLAIRSVDGLTTVGEELTRIGYLGSTTVRAREFDSYFELNLEQANTPEYEGRRQIGVATGTATSHFFSIRFHGEVGYVAKVPMALRKNAMAAGARLVAAIDDIGLTYQYSGGMAAASIFEVEPNLEGILANACRVQGDLLHPDPMLADEMMRHVVLAAYAAAGITQTSLEIDQTWEWRGITFSEEMNTAVRKVVKTLKLDQMETMSLSATSAYHLASQIPTASIFLYSDRGVVDTRAEDVNQEECATGANVLLHAVTAWADRQDEEALVP